MRILEINTEKTWRGGERQTFFTLTSLRSAGVQLSLMARKGFPLAQKAKEAGFHVHAVSGGLWSSFFFLAFKARTHADVLHAQTAKALTFCFLSKPFHRLPIVYTRRVDFIPKGKLTLMKYRACTRLVAISKAIQKILENQGLGPVVLIPSMIEPSVLNAKRGNQLLKDLKVPEGKRILGTAAALVDHKDPHTLMAALQKLKCIRTDWVFIHLGDGVLKEEMQTMAHSLGLDDFYIQAGHISQPEDLIQLFSLFVMSSKEEGLGSSVLDAFLYEVPVVSTNAGGLKELLENERGISVSVGDSEGLASAIDLVLQDAMVREKSVSNAKAYVLQRHSAAYHAAAYGSLFKEILKT
jgi:glycosyltransferase involved in cell wall biosynthesis